MEAIPFEKFYEGRKIVTMNKRREEAIESKRLPQYLVDS